MLHWTKMELKQLLKKVGNYFKINLDRFFFEVVQNILNNCSSKHLWRANTSFDIFFRFKNLIHHLVLLML